MENLATFEIKAYPDLIVTLAFAGKVAGIQPTLDPEAVLIPPSAFAVACVHGRRDGSMAPPLGGSWLLE